MSTSVSLAASDAPLAAVRRRATGARRVLLHLLLAAFVARANDELFRGFINWEEKHGFYQAILDLHGGAPDQYRILPLLPIRFFEHWFSFRLAVLAVDFLATFACLEIFWRLLAHRTEVQRTAFTLGFAGLALYTLYPGWRPDTFSLLALCALGLASFRRLAPSAARDALAVAGVAVVAFARADVALVYGVFLQSRRRATAWARGLVLVVPLAVQLLLARALFPQATYYMKVWTLADNLSLRFIGRTSVTYLVLALLLAGWGRLRHWVADVARADRPLVAACLLYLAAVVCFGRVNEYRLFLPLLPMLLVADGERHDRRVAA